jgi:hypothetical protein
LTVMLILAITASSALVFTDRVELLKLAVVLSLWAAVVGAFVSATYRRQSDADQAKARDLKLVYNLQLDREISARREYELNVESHLRRELASELSAHQADEVAALRAELAALRTGLEIFFDTDLGQRPAIETHGGYAEWPATTAPDRVASSRVTEVHDDDGDAETAESPIIDVPEEPLVSDTEPQPAVVLPGLYGGSHRRASAAEETRKLPPVPAQPPPNGQAAGPSSAPEPGVPGRHAGRTAHRAPAADAGAGTGAGQRVYVASNSSALAPRHRGAEDDNLPAAAGGQSVAELIARLEQTANARSSRRRRRKD